MKQNQRLESFRVVLARVRPPLHKFITEESKRQGKSIAMLVSELIEQAKRKREKEKS